MTVLRFISFVVVAHAFAACASTPPRDERSKTHTKQEDEATPEAAPSPSVEPASDPPVPAPAAGVGSKPPRFEFSSFGDLRPLANAERIVEATPVSLFELPNATVVARFKRTLMILPPPTDTKAALADDEEIVVLAGHGEFLAGSDYILFLKSFRDGSRYVAIERIASGDRDFLAKRQVLTAFAALDRILDESERVTKIRDLLLTNLKDKSEFVRWNALTELKALALARADVFTAEHRKSLVAVATAERGEVFRQGLKEILKLLGIELERTDRG